MALADYSLFIPTIFEVLVILSKPLSVVTPTVDGDVLRALALADASFTTGELHRLIGSHSVDGVRKVLLRLTEQGIVSAQPAGRAYLYRLNRDHLAAGPIEALARLREALVERLRAALGSWPAPPVYGALFGSAVRADMRLDSDLDLLIVRPDHTDNQEWSDQVAALSLATARWTGNDTRVLEYAEAEVRSRGQRDEVLAAIRDEGITVAGDCTWLQQVLRPRADAR
jgi:Nucleotidyltransferase domain